MTSNDIRNNWAWSRVEAMAEGSLDRAESERMLLAMRLDSRLGEAVARARHVRAGLRRLPRMRPPSGLLERLLAVPGSRRPSWTALTAPAGALAVAAIAALLVTSGRQSGDPRAEAVREFQIAMSYLNASAVLTHDEVRDQVGTGLADALAVSRESLRELDLSIDDNGG